MYNMHQNNENATNTNAITNTSNHVTEEYRIGNQTITLRRSERMDGVISLYFGASERSLS